MRVESIDKVIERCRDRINMSHNPSIDDVIRLIQEVESFRVRKWDTQPLWAGKGSGD